MKNQDLHYQARITMIIQLLEQIKDLQDKQVALLNLDPFSVMIDLHEINITSKKEKQTFKTLRITNFSECLKLSQELKISDTVLNFKSEGLKMCNTQTKTKNYRNEVSKGTKIRDYDVKNAEWIISDLLMNRHPFDGQKAVTFNQISSASECNLGLN